MSAEELVSGQPYLYKSNSGEVVEVLYKRFVRLPNGILAHNFRTRNGFANLSREEVAERISPYGIL